MDDSGTTRFATALGRCGIAWGPRGILRVWLPPAGVAASVGEAEPPNAVRRAMADIAALLRGEPSDLAGVVLDLTGVAPFPRQVYAAARAIPRGATRTYGELAAAIGAPGEARAVGLALARNPCPLVVPCHRVVAAGGRPGGFSARGGVALKLRLLALEGAAAGAQAELFGHTAGPGGGE